MVDTLSFATRLEVMSTSEVDNCKSIIEEGATLSLLRSNLEQY